MLTPNDTITETKIKKPDPLHKQVEELKERVCRLERMRMATRKIGGKPLPYGRQQYMR